MPELLTPITEFVYDLSRSVIDRSVDVVVVTLRVDVLVVDAASAFVEQSGISQYYIIIFIPQYSLHPQFRHFFAGKFCQN